MNPLSHSRLHQAALGLVCIIPLLFPGDAPFINDEPKLIGNALVANQQHTLAPKGLEGTRGVHYGPLPTWIYQAFLFVSHDLRVLTVMRVLLVTLLTAWALYQMGQALALWRWFSVIVLLSPYLWFYSRQLWDNSFAIPVSALAFSSYAVFRNTRSPRALLTLVACLCTLPLIHLMSLALVGPLGLYVLVVERKELWHHKWGVSAVVAGYVAVFRTYLLYLWHAVKVGDHNAPPPEATRFALYGAKLLSAAGLDLFYGDNWTRVGSPFVSEVLDVARQISLIAYPLAWAGMAIIVLQVADAFRKRRPLAPVEHLGLVALGVFVAQVELNRLTATFLYPHYYNATWIVFALFAWVTVDWLSRNAISRWIPVLQGAALAVVLVHLIIKVHNSSGNRTDHYGPTLNNQMELVEAMSEYSEASPVYSDVVNFLRFPHELRTVRALLPPQARGPRPTARLGLRYTTPDPDDGHVQLIAN